MIKNFSPTYFCRDNSVNVRLESPVYQLYKTENRNSLSSVQPILGHGICPQKSFFQQKSNALYTGALIKKI